MTVEELLARAGSAELAEWRAYEQEYGPLGPDRGDWLAGLVASVIANVNRPPKSRAFKVSDFVPSWGRKKPQDPQSMLAVFKALAGRGNRVDDR